MNNDKIFPLESVVRLNKRGKELLKDLSKSYPDGSIVGTHPDYHINCVFNNTHNGNFIDATSAYFELMLDTKDFYE